VRPAVSSAGEIPVSLLAMPTVARPRSVYSLANAANSVSRWRTNGQWLLRKTTSTGRPEKSDSLTSEPVTEGRANSGAAVPSGTRNEDTGITDSFIGA
jgi:hypothetical protein